MRDGTGREAERLRERVRESEKRGKDQDTGKLSLEIGNMEQSK